MIALALFAASFALHIVGGATDQAWLFAIAVALIATCAVGFPWLAAALGRPRSAGEQRLTLLLGFAFGTILTASALWAANDRSWAWWHGFAAIAAVGAVAFLALQRGGARLRPRRGSPSPG